MRKAFEFVVLFLLFMCYGWSQTKVSGVVVDDEGEPVPFANVVFKNSIEGTITNEDGRFYMESEKTYTALFVTFVGYTDQEIALEKRINYNMRVVLEYGERLQEVVVYTGKQPKKNNPAIDILKKIWSRKRRNGLKMFRQYQYDKYEKIEFDLNTIDTSLIKSRIFKGMEFILEQVDTSNITGKTYLPIFINEKLSKVYGDNTINKEKEELLGNNNSGFQTNQSIIAFVNDLYSDYNIYDNYLKFFDKSFVSPLSRTGVEVYNYVLNDSAYIEGKWCYNIIYYPRRKSELTFKGDFWVNDTTYAIKNINMQATKSANINWVKNIYIEQDFEVLNDSVFLLKRDYFLTDFALNKKEESRGVYGKRTTVYDNYTFNVPLPKSFYNKDVDEYNEEAFTRNDEFWEQNRLEKLNEDERGIYEMLDTLQEVPRFKQISTAVSILGSGYVEIDKWNLDLGSIYSAFGYNDVEGLRLRAGARTYFGQNDPWRIEVFGAYGFRDSKFKYGISGKWLLNRDNRLILSGGTRRDVEQTAATLTSTTDVLGRSRASSSLLAVGDNSRLTDINISTLELEIEPRKNFTVALGSAYRTMKSASPDTFSLEYFDPRDPTGIASELKQLEALITFGYFPKRIPVGYGVERLDQNDDFARYYFRVTQGFDGITDQDFQYTKTQLLFTKPWQIGGFGRLRTTLEAGKTFGTVPLGLLSVVPGNQTFFSIYNTFPALNFYEFITDTYVSVHLEHNFNGRLFARIPFLRKFNLREIVGLRGIWGDISNENIAINLPAFSSLTLNPDAIAPTDEIYWEYSFGIDNIFRLLRIDFNFRGNYFDNIDARRFSVTFNIGFNF